MPTEPFILLPPAAPAHAGWRIGAVVGGKAIWTNVDADVAAGPDVPTGPSSAAESVAAVTAVLGRLGYAGQGLVLALPTAWCLVAPVRTDGIPPHDRKALSYRLEERLPLAAEEVVADFVHPPADANRAMGVCARIDVVRPVVDALEAAGVAVRSIAPLSLLIAQGLLAIDEAAPAASESKVVVFPDVGDEMQEGRRLALVALDGDVPVVWVTAAAEPDDVALRLSLLTADLPGRPASPSDSTIGPPSNTLPLESLGLDAAAVVTLFGPADTAAVVRHDEPPMAAALRAAAAALEGRRAPWVDLRRDALAARDRLRAVRRPLNAALAAAAGLLLVAAALAYARAGWYDRSARADEGDLVREVRAAFPGWFADAAAADVRAALARERRATALARAGGGTGGLPPQANRSALRTLLAVVGRLPTDLPVRVERATFDEAAFELTGRARGYDDVDRAAAAVRAGGLDVPPPQARRGPDGTWNFTLRGTVPPTAAAVAAGG